MKIKTSHIALGALIPTIILGVLLATSEGGFTYIQKYGVSSVMGELFFPFLVLFGIGFVIKYFVNRRNKKDN